MEVKRSKSLPLLSLSTNVHSLHESRLSLDLPILNPLNPITKDIDGDPDRIFKSPRLAAQMCASSDCGIIEIIHQFIRDERLRSFCFLAQHSHRHMGQEELLVLSQATSDDIQAIRDRDHQSRLAKFSDSDWFTFHEPMVYDSWRRTVAITIAQGQVATIEDLNITTPSYKCSIQSIAAATWLRQTYNLDDDWIMKFSETQYEEQQLWWNSNGKTFRLFDLPLELREAVYLSVVGPVVVPELYQSRVVLGNGFSYGDPARLGRNRDPDVARPNMTIMRVSKLVRREATLVAYGDTFKRFRVVGTCNHSSPITKPLHLIATLMTGIKSSTPHAAFLRNVQLEMSAASYFASIGIQPALDSPLRIAPSSFRLSSLQEFPALRHLDFHFIGPKHADAICPWALIAQSNQFGEHSCQKIWIDWFFIFAWAVIKALPNVKFTLSGCVKASGKTHWERVLNDKRADPTPDIHKAKKQIWQQKKDIASILCKCSSPCSKAGVEARKVYSWDAIEIRRIEGLQEHIDAIYWDYED
jgi:hypothetical protein